MSDAIFSFRVDESLKTAFSIVARPCARNGAQLLRDFMRDFVRQQQEADNDDAWFRREVQGGIDAANAGDLVSAEEVEADAITWREATGQRIISAIDTSTL